jgi:hypothetical protein
MKPINNRFRALLFVSVLFVWPVSIFAQRGTPQTIYLADNSDLDQATVGGEYISIIGARALDEVIDELQPQFNLTAEEALQKAVPDTLNSSATTSSSSKFALQIMLAQILNSTNGSNSAISSQPSSLDILTNFPFALSVDPMLQYRAAASLYENVKLLNRSLKDIPRFDGYVPYIVTIQISLIPYRHEAPYDTYADVAFFTDSNTAPESPGPASETIPMVYPMPTSDALEMSNDQQSRNQLRELNVVLEAATHGVGVQAATEQQKQRNETSSGYNLNSLVTVGRISQNCMQVRIGARNAAGLEQFNMLPETRNVTFLVFAPKDAKELQMLSHTVFRDIKTDRVLKELSDEKVESDFLVNVIGGWFNELKETLNKKTFKSLQKTIRCNPSAHKAFHDFVLNRIVNTLYDTNSTDGSTFSGFQCAFKEFFNDPNIQPTLIKAGVSPNFFCDPFNGLDVNDIDAIWLDATRSTGLGDQYANDRIRLSVPEAKFPATNLTVLRADDGKSSILTISGGHSLPQNRIHAILTCSNGYSFDSDVVNVTDGDTTIQVHFPLLSALSNTMSSSASHFEPISLELQLQEYGGIMISSNYTEFANVDSNTKNEKMSTTTPAAWNIIRTYGALTAGVTNDFGIVLATNATFATGTNQTWYLDVANAIVVATTNTPRVLPNGMYQLNATNDSTEIVFTLKPLPSGQAVDFNLWNEKELVTNLNHQVVYPSSSSSAGTQTSKPN